MEGPEFAAAGKIIVNWLHLSAAMIWLGAVFTGGFVMHRTVAHERQTARERLIGSFYGAFSPFAWGALGVLIVTGVTKAGGHLERGAVDLIATEWGRLLSLKLTIAILMVTAGAHATYGLAPKLRPQTGVDATGRVASRAPTDRARLQKRLRFVSRLAAFLGFALLFVVTLL